VGPDGRWVYVAHTLGRVGVPSSQVERGWINTNALSIIDLAERKLFATVLLDRPERGAADPWGLVCSADGASLWVTVSGAHQIAEIDLAQLHQFAEGRMRDDHPLGRLPVTEFESIWTRIRSGDSRREELANALGALDSAELIERTDLPGKGPRGADLSPDGSLLAVAAYFSGDVILLDTATHEIRETIPLGPDEEPDPVRLGQMIFHDADYCFQGWMSCATCHANEARTDGLNWDLLNDGAGNPKNGKSLLLADRTSPAMWRGVRDSLHSAVEAGFHHFFYRQPDERVVEAVSAYLGSLEPEPSPYLDADGRLSAQAERGKRIFESARADCARCHPAPLYTDLQMHDVGTASALGKPDESEFDTPNLLELYRTSPYLHDGSAATLRELLSDRNPLDAHGTTSRLDEAEMGALVTFLLSL